MLATVGTLNVEHLDSSCSGGRRSGAPCLSLLRSSHNNHQPEQQRFCKVHNLHTYFVVVGKNRQRYTTRTTEKWSCYQSLRSFSTCTWFVVRQNQGPPVHGGMSFFVFLCVLCWSHFGYVLSAQTMSRQRRSGARKWVTYINHRTDERIDIYVYYLGTQH